MAPGTVHVSCHCCRCCCQCHALRPQPSTAAGPGVRGEALSFTRSYPKLPVALDIVPTPVQRYRSPYRTDYRLTAGSWLDAMTAGRGTSKAKGRPGGGMVNAEARTQVLKENYPAEREGPPCLSTLGLGRGCCRPA